MKGEDSNGDPFVESKSCEYVLKDLFLTQIFACLWIPSYLKANGRRRRETEVVAHAVFA